MASPKVILITGASTGFGAIAARLLSQSSHTVYAGMRSHEEVETAAAREFAISNKVNLSPIILDVTNDESISAAVAHVLRQSQRIDVIVHNAGLGAAGPAEAFTPGQLASYFDVNVLGAHRLNRAVLPQMRKAGKGLLVWTSSSSTRGGTPPFLAPYFAAKAAMDSLAVSYSAELARWGIETAIIVPGPYTKETKFFDNMDKPIDQHIAAEYDQGPYKGTMKEAIRELDVLAEDDADPRDVAQAMVRVINLPHGKRPFRTHIGPSSDGAEVVNGVADRIREDLLRRIGLEDLLKAT